MFFREAILLITTKIGTVEIASLNYESKNRFPAQSSLSLGYTVFNFNRF